mgnify:CR=1 FL=1
MVVAEAQQRAKGRAFEIRKGFPRVKGPVVTDDKGGHAFLQSQELLVFLAL